VADKWGMRSDVPQSPGWDWFDDVALAGRVQNDEGDKAANLAIAFARCFASPDGQVVLRHLRAVTLDRSLGPGASDALLRHLEGQRQLVAHILSLTARGAGDAGASL
jgi:hypothetical protein